MIFVTVGTHEQPFNRLVRYMDMLKENNLIDDDVIIQTGYSTYVPRFCSWKKLFPYQKMIENVEAARIVITHGGPSSFIMPIQVGKIPIVVPRQNQYDEHVNNHQVDFSRTVAKRQGNIIVVEEIIELENKIAKYEEIVKTMHTVIKSNNMLFNENFKKMVNEIFE